MADIHRRWRERVERDFEAAREKRDIELRAIRVQCEHNGGELDFHIPNDGGPVLFSCPDCGATFEQSTFLDSSVYDPSGKGSSL